MKCDSVRVILGSLARCMSQEVATGPDIQENVSYKG